MKRYSLLVTEGPHDQATITKILQCNNFRKFKGHVTELDKTWTPMIPHYPKNHNLYARLDMPSLLETDNLSVAIYQSTGLTNINLANGYLEQFDFHLDAFGVIVDMDNHNPTSLGKLISEQFIEQIKNFPTQLGQISSLTIGKNKEVTRCGAYAIPDNQSTGTLESILISCGKNTYPTYIEKADEFLRNIEKDCNHSFQNFDREKALIASIASVLRPGKTNTVTISDDQWISDNSISQVHQLKLLSDFLKELLKW